MTMIAEYYARVGVDVDKKSYEDVDKQLSRIESRVESFKNTVSKHSKVDVKFTLNTKGFSTKVREALKNISHSSMSSLRLRNFTVDNKAVSDALKQAVQATADRTRQLKFQAIVDKTSVKTARNEVAEALTNIKFRPLIDITDVKPVDMLHGFDTISKRLNGVQKRVQAFSRRIERMMRFNVRFTFDHDMFARTLRVAMSRLAKSKGINLKLDNLIAIDSKALVERINNGLKAQAAAQQGVKLDAELSKSALNNIKQQIKNSLKDMKIDIKAGQFIGMDSAAKEAAERTRQRTHPLKGVKDPYPSNVRRTDPTSRRVMSPYYNPMMVGGALGAFMRFGVHALPFYAGVMGLGALTGAARERSSQKQRISGYELLFHPIEGMPNILKDLEDLSVYLGAPIEQLADSLLPFARQMKDAGEQKWTRQLFILLSRIAYSTGTEAELPRELESLAKLVGDPKEEAKRLEKAPESELPIVYLEIARALEMTPKRLVEGLASGNIDLIKQLKVIEGSFTEIGDIARSRHVGSVQFQAAQLAQEMSRRFNKALDNSSKSLGKFYDSLRGLADTLFGDGEALGGVFDALFRAARAVMDGFNQLVKYFQGEDSPSNMFVRMFGAFDAEAARQFFSSLWEVIKKFSVMFGGWVFKNDPTHLDPKKGVVALDKRAREEYNKDRQKAFKGGSKAPSDLYNYLSAMRLAEDTLSRLEALQDLDLKPKERTDVLLKLFRDLLLSERKRVESGEGKSSRFLKPFRKEDTYVQGTSDKLSTKQRREIEIELKSQGEKFDVVISRGELEESLKDLLPLFIGGQYPFEIPEEWEKAGVESVKDIYSGRGKSSPLKSLVEAFGGLNKALEGFGYLKPLTPVDGASAEDDTSSEGADDLLSGIISENSVALNLLNQRLEKPTAQFHNTFDVSLRVDVEDSSYQGMAKEIRRVMMGVFDEAAERMNETVSVTI